MVADRPLRLLVSAAEPSGDRLGAELLAALRQRAPVEAVGLVGPLMEAEGARLLPGVAWLPPAMGVVEVIQHLRGIRRNRAALLAASEGMDAVVCIDAPDFHLPLARAARDRGRTTVGFVSPQLWAWRPGRAPTVARAFDRLLCLFSFEPPLYAATPLRAVHVGHPAVDRVAPSRREPGVLAVFPGSRPAEVRRHLPVFLEAAGKLGAKEILVAEAPGTRLDPRWLESAVGARVVPGGEALARAEQAISKSGTVTLELALAGIPFVVAHRVSPLTYWIGRALVHGVRHLALPNVLCREEVVPELVQHFDADALVAALGRARPVDRSRLADILGAPGVAARAAQELLHAVSWGKP